MGKEQGLFKMPPTMEGVDFEKMLHGIANSEDFDTLSDLNPYIRISNKPKAKLLKSIEGPDLNSGSLGDKVYLYTDCGWSFVYHVAKDKLPAHIEVSAGVMVDETKLQQEVRELTHQARTFRTAIEIVDFLIVQGWEKFTIEEGSPALSWAVWAYLTQLEKAVSGFKADEFDQLKLKNSKDLFTPIQESVVKLASGNVPAGPGGVVSTTEGDE
jgi:hypothetical protein